MRFLARLTIPSIIGVSLLLAACGSSSYSGSSATNTSKAQPASQTTGSSAALVKTGSSSLGTVLVNGSGMTLYALSAEQGGKFICTNSSCTAIWHPLTLTAGTTPKGDVSALATVKRPDGTTQVTYKGAPLYTFAQDQQPGDTNGQGFKDVGTWSAVTVSGAAPATSASHTTTQSTSQTTTPSEMSSGGGGRYGY
jgi:predicted lipoprotein with Yx(FWY)xxD motif